MDFGKGLTVVWITVLAYSSYLYHFSFCSRTLQAIVICVCACMHVYVCVCVSGRERERKCEYVFLLISYFISEMLMLMLGNIEAGWANKSKQEKGNGPAGENQACSCRTPWAYTAFSFVHHTPSRYIRNRVL